MCSGKYVALNRDKRSLVLDLKQPAGRGVMTRLGVGSDALLRENPRLVVCAISGYAADGPYRNRAAHDLNAVGLSSVLRAEGAALPSVPPYPLSDLSAEMNARARSGSRCRRWPISPREATAQATSASQIGVARRVASDEITTLLQAGVTR